MTISTLPLIWIDGSTGTLGKAVLKKLVSRGYRTLSLMRTAPKSDSENLHPHVILPEDPALWEKSIHLWIQQQGIPSGLVCMSGIHLNRLLSHTKTEHWHQLLEANLLHQAKLIRHLLPRMMSQGGSLVLCSSLASRHPRTGQVAYASTKGAVESFCRALAREVGGKQIRVNAVAPGFIRSPMLETLPEAALQSIFSEIPLQRPGLPDEVAATVEFLLSEKSAYITGQTFRIDGGRS